MAITSDLYRTPRVLKRWLTAIRAARLLGVEATVTRLLRRKLRNEVLAGKRIFDRGNQISSQARLNDIALAPRGLCCGKNIRVFMHGEKYN